MAIEVAIATTTQLVIESKRAGAHETIITAVIRLIDLKKQLPVGHPMRPAPRKFGMSTAVELLRKVSATNPVAE